ncbi:hypothetical protein BKA65DRAFT_607787 [Rhexocercosporidium sp. MPI-PUGE-AT-0058]|nr:hypothetical protein BKA65DRAFT_607787 [Rhexocercosporidium sp. MPI-PUGE-AT-0058]
MTSSQPITPRAFAAALPSLPLSTLFLKAAELRNSIAHLDYSNEQLRPFADGTEASTNGVPDGDCVEAIRENEEVVRRMVERLGLLREEVEGRGVAWGEDFRGKEEAEGRSSAWSDGTFQTGRIVNGEVRMDGEADTGAGVQTNGAVNGNGTGTGSGTSSNAGGRLDDEALRRGMEERMRALAEGDEEGMHL